jgi:ATP-dependent DNA ligase
VTPGVALRPRTRELIYVGRIGTGMSEKVLKDLRRRLGAVEIPFEHPAATHAIARRSSSRAFIGSNGRTEACGRDHLLAVDRRRPVAADGQCGLREEKPAHQVRRERPAPDA